MLDVGGEAVKVSRGFVHHRENALGGPSLRVLRGWRQQSAAQNTNSKENLEKSCRFQYQPLPGGLHRVSHLFSSPDTPVLSPAWRGTIQRTALVHGIGKHKLWLAIRS
jgi:hypothetical protein